LVAFGTTESRALTRFVAGLGKAARGARIPGLKIETRASQTPLVGPFKNAAVAAFFAKGLLLKVSR
jgi:hypothetical protein